MVAKTNSLHNRSTVPSYEFSLRDADIARNTTHVDKNRLSPNSFDAFVPRFFAQVAAGGHRGWDSCTRNSDFFTNGIDFFATGLDFFTKGLDVLTTKVDFFTQGIDFFTTEVDSCTKGVDFFTEE